VDIVQVRDEGAILGNMRKFPVRFNSEESGVLGVDECDLGVCS
jgi:hypothetical protein